MSGFNLTATWQIDSFPQISTPSFYERLTHITTIFLDDISDLIPLWSVIFFLDEFVYELDVIVRNEASYCIIPKIIFWRRRCFCGFCVFERRDYDKPLLLILGLWLFCFFWFLFLGIGYCTGYTTEETPESGIYFRGCFLSWYLFSIRVLKGNFEIVNGSSHTWFYLFININYIVFTSQSSSISVAFNIDNQVTSIISICWNLPIGLQMPLYGLQDSPRPRRDRLSW
jgi:hypothetical protein